MFSAPQECSHHPDTVNDQLQTKKRDVRVHVSSLDAGNHHQRGQKQHGASGKTSARGRRAWPPILAPSLTRTHLSQGFPLSPSRLPFLHNTYHHLTHYILTFTCFLSVSAYDVRDSRAGTLFCCVSRHLQPCLAQQGLGKCVFKVVDLNYFSSLCFMLLIYHMGDNTMHI